MIEEREFVVMGEPKPKGRPRFSRHGKYTVAYTDDKTVCYENLVAMSYQQSNGKKKPYKKGVTIDMVAYFQLPKKYYWPVNKKHNGELRPEGEELLHSGAYNNAKDTDNLIKSCLDGLNHAGVWEDDRQVVKIEASKVWCESRPRLEVIISGEVEDP